LEGLPRFPVISGIMRYMKIKKFSIVSRISIYLLREGFYR
jgi:hypothetical protein